MPIHRRPCFICCPVHDSIPGPLASLAERYCVCSKDGGGTSFLPAYSTYLDLMPV